MADIAMPAGTPAITTTITATIETTATVPATSLSADRPARQFVVGTTAPGAPCEVHAWCVETGDHVEHVGRLVELPEVSAQIWQDTDDAPPTIVVGNPQDDYQSFTSGQQLRERAAQIRGSSARLDALADQFDALCEAGGTTTAKPVSVCAYDGRPAATVRTGQHGAQYGLCTDCAEWTTATMTAAEPARRWSVTTELGVKVDGYLPAWSEEDPSRTNIPANRLQMVLSDLTFTRDYPGQAMTVDTPSGMDDPREVGEMEVFRAQIWCAPHDANHPNQREPYGIITVLPDCTMDHLEPDDLTIVAAKLRAQADRIDQAAADLAAARADWARNGGARS